MLSLTIDHWRTLQDEERKQEINAAIKLALAPAAKKTATKEVEEVLANLDAINPSKQLLDLINTRMQAGLAKIKQGVKRDLRKKNYLAGSKIQVPTPTANGHNSRKASTAATSWKQKQKQKKKAMTPKHPNKAKPVSNGLAMPKRRNRSIRGQDSCGGSRNARPPKGARRCQKVLSAHVASSRRHMNCTNQLIGKYHDLLKQQYGFVADETQSLWKRVERRIGEMNVDEWCTRPRNMACHNLLKHSRMPPCTTKLLGLGLNYCIKSTTTKETTTQTFEQLADDVRMIYALQDVENDDDSYTPSLYIKSEYRFNLAPVLIENALVS